MLKNAPPTTYFAHSIEHQAPDQWQLLAQHLSQVGELAARFAGVFGASELALAQGLLHDLGKYTAEFQRRLHGDPRRCDHATWGAKIACERYANGLGQLIAYGIAGHHTGLADGDGQDGERTSLKARLVSDLPELNAAWQDEIELPKTMLPPTKFCADKNSAMFQLTMLVRMLFSCLVDADFLDTERFYDLEKNQARLLPQTSLTALRDHLDQHLRSLPTGGDINAKRAEILHTVRSRAGQPPGLFSLTVPTGGGKTLASLAFALDHALAHGLQRVIFVIPFTSIVEQTAEVFRQALGALGAQAVLEHHSAFTDNPAHSPESQAKLRLPMENWDAPIIVTTAVQFFESLFAARPSACRKLHNIAGSVVVLDEAQTLPLKVLRPCVAALQELARNYRSTLVLCTATQPALHAPEFEHGFEQVRELAPDPAHLFTHFQRVRVKHIGTLSDDALTEHLRSREQVLCIVNNRRHAKALYRSIQDQPGAYHLSTLMCAKHRSDVLAQVRKMLHEGQPCKVVSTSLIEAGVDISFPTVLRAQAGLDAIAQAAGRCNREGKFSVDASEVLVFTTDNPDWAPPPELTQFANTAQEILRAHPQDDPLSPQVIRAYFQHLYWQKGSPALDHYNLLGLTRLSRPDSLPMETLATKFRMIDSLQFPVIIDYDGISARALRDLQYAQGCAALARKLQPYTVQLPRAIFQTLKENCALLAIQSEKWGEQFMVLSSKKLYDPQHGICWEGANYLSLSELTC
jgi:CRISPR-associated endonuclease/helicase Cas3